MWVSIRPQNDRIFAILVKTASRRLRARTRRFFVDRYNESMEPLILTADFCQETQDWFEAKRQQHFPPERNFIPAHLSLFHHLPGDEADFVVGKIADVVDRCEGALPARVTGIRFLGFGSAYDVDSPELSKAREELAESFWDRLNRQDRQKFQPHVTFQNKVPAELAKATLQLERSSFEAFESEIVALRLWRYLGGPWEEFDRFSLMR